MEKIEEVLTFGGEYVEIVIGKILHCPTKNTFVDLSLVEKFRETGEVGKKMAVGTNQGKICYIWKDSDFVHIDCLKETLASFDRKYIQLIKTINQ